MPRGIPLALASLKQMAGEMSVTGCHWLHAVWKTASISYRFPVLDGAHMGVLKKLARAMVRHKLLCRTPGEFTTPRKLSGKDGYWETTCCGCKSKVFEQEQKKFK